MEVEMARFDLTDFEWSVIQPLLPNKPRGVARVDDRRVLNVAQGGRLGSAFGSGVKGLRWRYPDDRLNPRSACISTPPKKDERCGCMGRSRGGLTTKIHALVDAEGLPIALKLTEGQAHDGRSGRDMLDALVEGQTLLADRAYDSDELRRSLDERGAWANIKSMPNRKNVPAFSSYLYRYRNLVERFFNKIKHYRAVASDTTKRHFLAGVTLASLRIWMRFNESIT